ncbi:MAG: RodZ domain-containing protein [Deltaproteobacteria bacterium]
MESPGEYLKRERELRGVSLSKVFAVTRVSLRYLQALESDDYENLPHPTFVKGFIKTYCKFLGLDETDAVLRYELYLKEHLSPAGEHGAAKEMGLWDSGGSAKGFGGLGVFFSDNKKLIAAASAAGIAIIVILYLVIAVLWREDSVIAVNEAKEAEEAVTAPENQAGAPGPSAERESTVSVEAPLTDGAKAGATEATKKQSLTVEALDIVWIKIRIDHDEPFDVLLRKGDRVTWRGNEGFSLLIGNAGGVALTYNGERLNAVGRQGEVVSIKLPKTPLRPVKKPAGP